MSDYQVAVFPVTEDGKLVLVKTRDGDYWIFPKGRRERGRKDYEVAEDEAFEEAGLLGRISRDWERFPVNSKKASHLKIYPMRVKKVLSNWPERRERERLVVSFDQAETLLSKDLREILKAMRKQVREGTFVG